MNPISLIFQLQHYREQRRIPIYALRRHARPDRLDWLRRDHGQSDFSVTADSFLPSEQLKRYASLPNPLGSTCCMKMTSSALSMTLENGTLGRSADRYPRLKPVTRAHVVSNVDKVKCEIAKMGPFEKGRVKMAIVYALMAHGSVVLEEYRAEDDDDVPTMSGNNNMFFATVVGVTYHANSFLDLNLLRPLLRACEARYCKHTLIQ
ncbi:dead box ATP-dependent RNA helicase, partial [Striga asiatica]